MKSYLSLYFLFSVTITNIYMLPIEQATIPQVTEQATIPQVTEQATIPQVTEQATEQATEQVTEQATIPQVTEQATEQVTEQANEQVTEQATEQVTEQVTEQDYIIDDYTNPDNVIISIASKTLNGLYEEIKNIKILLKSILKYKDDKENIDYPIIDKFHILSDEEINDKLAENTRTYLHENVEKYLDTPTSTPTITPTSTPTSTPTITPTSTPTITSKQSFIENHNYLYIVVAILFVISIGTLIICGISYKRNLNKNICVRNRRDNKKIINTC